MKTKLSILTILLLVSIGSYMKYSHRDHIRPIDFMTIMAIGVITGILISTVKSLITRLKDL